MTYTLIIARHCIYGLEYAKLTEIIYLEFLNIYGGTEMAGDINYFFGIGNLTRDPDLRYTPQGTPVCRFDIAMNRIYQNKNGQQTKDTTFLRITAWSKLGENCARFLHKGSRVAVVGELLANNWEDRNGTKRTSYEVRAMNVQFLSPLQKANEEIREIGENFSSEAEIEPFSFDSQNMENALGELEDISPEGSNDVAPF